MSYYDYEDYYEQSEFDEKVEEFKDYLRKSVKKETQKLIEKLQKENAELRKVRDNWNELKCGYEEKVRQFEWQVEQEKLNAKRMRLEELFDAVNMNVILYRAEGYCVRKPKCNKCDPKRKIYFLSPSGKDFTEDCECAKSYYKYAPTSYYLSEFRVKRENDDNSLPFFMWFEKYKDSEEEDGYTYESSDLCRNIYNGETFEEVEKNKNVFYFREKKKCQEYCDWVNRKNKITDDMN